MRDPLGYYSNNTMNTCALLDVAIKAGVQQFIFSSTAAVYGNAEHVPVREDATTAPISPYGTSKLMSEIMLHDAGAAHGLRFVILRYFNVAGADPKLRTGQSTPMSTHLIKVACEAALGKRPKIDVFGTDYPTPDGTCIRDYIHVTDLARAHSAALAYLRARRRQRDIQLRLRAWRFCVTGDRGGAARQPARFSGRDRRATAGRSARAGGRRRAHSVDARLATAVRGPRYHRYPCARLGTAAAGQARKRLGLTPTRNRRGIRPRSGEMKISDEFTIPFAVTRPRPSIDRYGCTSKDSNRNYLGSFRKIAPGAYRIGSVAIPIELQGHWRRGA